MKVEGGSEDTFRPLTLEEEEKLGQAPFPERQGEGSESSDDEEGWETTEEDPDDDEEPRLQEEDLD